jgi:hypothetical protein
MEQLKKLYELLKANYEPNAEDLSYEELPDENIDINTQFPEMYKHLATQSYVCCDQKIIYWDESTGYFILSDLYNCHPSLRYKTDKEVLSFFIGYQDSFDSYFEFDETSFSSNPVSKAKIDGVFTRMKEAMEGFEHLYKQNTTETIVYEL